MGRPDKKIKMMFLALIPTVVLSSKSNGTTLPPPLPAMSGVIPGNENMDAEPSSEDEDVPFVEEDTCLTSSQSPTEEFREQFEKFKIVDGKYECPACQEGIERGTCLENSVRVQAGPQRDATFTCGHRFILAEKGERNGPRWILQPELAMVRGRSRHGGYGNGRRLMDRLV